MELEYVEPVFRSGPSGRDAEFLVVVPTVRECLPEFESALAAIKASFSLPTELHVLRGTHGKAQTLNLAYDILLTPSTAPVYVTLDDDHLPGPGWQDSLVRAFAVNPKWGALGMWFEEDWHDRILAERCGEEDSIAEIRYRPVPHCIIGSMIAMRREVAIKIGKIPPSDEKYQMWEDGWRGERVKHLGFEMAYIIGPTPTMIWYSDPASYIDGKLADIEHAKQNMSRYMAVGLRPSLVRRVWNRIVSLARGNR